jgi:carbonyl reductase 1
MSATEQQRVILVTGANKGIGFELVKKLVQQSSIKSNDIILLGSRDLKRGQDALTQLGSPSNVHLFQLDTSSKESINRVTNEIKQTYGGLLDVIINNAAIIPKDKTVQAARETFATNYYGVKILNEHLIPLLRENGRVINVASNMGALVLHGVSKDIQEKYTSSTLTTEQLDQLVEDFISAVESNTVETVGYNKEIPLLPYGVSKAALIALTRIEARQWSGAKKIFVYAVCPGYCSTGISRYAPDSRPPELGADSILYVVNTPSDELENGAFYRDGIQLPQIYTDDAGVRQAIERIKKVDSSE